MIHHIVMSDIESAARTQMEGCYRRSRTRMVPECHLWKLGRYSTQVDPCVSFFSALLSAMYTVPKALRSDWFRVLGSGKCDATEFKSSFTHLLAPSYKKNKPLIRVFSKMASAPLRMCILFLPENGLSASPFLEDDATASDLAQFHRVRHILLRSATTVSSPDAEAVLFLRRPFAAGRKNSRLECCRTGACVSGSLARSAIGTVFACGPRCVLMARHRRAETTE